MLPSLTLASLLALGALASARQQPAPTSRVQPITGTIRDAGTYHVATGTWTRKARQAHVGADIIYNNTCSSGYFGGLSGDHFVDEGRIPSPSAPTDANSRPGCNTQYMVDGFQIAYCTDQPSLGTYTVNFYESYQACASVIGVTPTAGFAVTGLPAGAAGPACWVVTIDLDSPPQTASLAFPMRADGDGTFTGGSDANLFGWEMSSTLPPASLVYTGPVIAGDPGVCSGFDGTRWDFVVNYAEAGTGMGTLNQFRVESGPTWPGCHFFGSLIPMASFHLELYADACGVDEGCQTCFCFGDGTGVPCPCGNNSILGSGQGCLHSLGTGGKLLASGTASISNDTVTLLGTLMPNASALYYQGTIQQGGGAGAVFGDGKRCVGGTTIRLKTVLNVGGASQYPQPGDPSISVKGLITVPGTRTYQVWFRNAATFCTPATFNLTNGIEISWGS
jgi:hypothetical protein